MTPPDPTFWELVSNVADSLEERAELNIELVKAQIAREAKEIGRGGAPLALGALLLGVGYIFVCVAASLALASWLTAPVGVAVVGAFNLVIGGVCLSYGLSVWNARSALAAAPTRQRGGGSALDVV